MSFEGDVSLDTIVKIAKRYHEYGFTGVGLGDTTGMATPPIVTKFVRTLQDAYRRWISRFTSTIRVVSVW